METHFHFRFLAPIFISCLLLLSLPYPLLTLKLVIYFFPLLSSTTACFAVAYLFMLSERQEAKEVLLVDGQKSEHGIVQVYDNVNQSMYKEQIDGCCFMLKTKHGPSEDEWEEDCDGGVVFSAKLQVGVSSNFGFFSEEVASCVVDKMAEGAWNCYFGKSSKWHYKENLLESEWLKYVICGMLSCFSKEMERYSCCGSKLTFDSSSTEGL